MARWMRRTGLICTGLALCTFAAVQAQEFRAQNGVVLPAPAIEGLDCPAIEDTLTTLDSSNYRSAAPVPEGHPDRPIYDYENALSEQNYLRCIQEQSALQDPGEAFRHGFTDAASMPAAGPATGAEAEVLMGGAPADGGAMGGEAADTGTVTGTVTAAPVPAARVTAEPPPSE